MGVPLLPLSPNVKRLAAGGSDGSVRLWDLETQQEVANLGQQRSNAHELAWTPNGNTLISVSSEKVTVWQAPSFGQIDAWDVKQTKPPN